MRIVLITLSRGVLLMSDGNENEIIVVTTTRNRSAFLHINGLDYHSK